MGGARPNTQAVDINKLTALKFPRSDGDPTRRPPNVDPTPMGGEVNYHRFVSNIEPASQAWRTKSAAAVATHMGLKDPDTYYFEDWPEHFAFYDHNKGPVINPRHDLYLYGSVQKFRSVNEFVPHAIWLMTDETLDRSNCKCKYCTKSKTQAEISKAHGLSTTASSSVIKKENIELGGDFRPALTPLKRKEPPRQLANHDRVNDLRMHRWFREAEVVWCALAPALPSTQSGAPNSPSAVAEYWPGLVQETILKVYTGRSISPEKYANVHRWTYKIKLLALEQTVVMPEAAILPYQAYQPSESLLLKLAESPKLSIVTRDDMQLVAKTSINVVHVPTKPDEEILVTKHAPEGYASTLEEVATPLTLAIEIAAQITRLWTVTDQWQFQSVVESRNGEAETTLSETRFQGLWWGSERIWQEDLVRLKMKRDMLAKPDEGRVFPATPGAENRSVLLRVASIFHDPSVQTCRVSGMLYEVAENGWDKKYLDPALHPPSPSRSQPPKLSVDFDPQKFDPPFTPQANGSKANGLDSHRPLDATPSTSRRIFMSPPSQPPSTLSSPPKIDSTKLTSIPFSPSRKVMSPRLQPVALLESRAEDESSLSYPAATHQDSTQFGEYRFSLPPPPNGYVFRPILAEDQEVWVDLSFVAGRYYPQLLEAPLVKQMLEVDEPMPDALPLNRPSAEVTSPPHSASSVPLFVPSPITPPPASSFSSTPLRVMSPSNSSQHQHPNKAHPKDLKTFLRTLNGLTPGYLNAVEACLFKLSRYHIVRHADMQARMICHEAWNMPDKSMGVEPSTAFPLEVEPSPPPESQTSEKAGKEVKTMGGGLFARTMSLFTRSG